MIATLAAARIHNISQERIGEMWGGGGGGGRGGGKKGGRGGGGVRGKFLAKFFQAEDGIRDVERSRGLGDVYKRQDPRLLMTQSYHVKFIIVGFSLKRISIRSDNFFFER